VSHGAAANWGSECPILSTQRRRDGNRGVGKNVEIYSEKLKIVEAIEFYRGNRIKVVEFYSGNR
jgi:hypothetical protein